MADLDSNFDELRAAIDRAAGAGDFGDVRRRHRALVVRRSIAAAGVAVLVAGGASWAALGGGGDRTLHQVPVPAASSTPSPNPTQTQTRAQLLAAKRAQELHVAAMRAQAETAPFQPSGMSFSDAMQGAVIGWRCVGSVEPACVSAVQTSNDGGATWHGKPAFGPLVAQGSTDPLRGGASSVLAIDGRTIWAYDPGLFVSRDGGTTFSRLPVSKAVTHVVATGTTIWITTSACSDGATHCRSSYLSGPADGSRQPRPLTGQPQQSADASPLGAATTSVAYVYDGPRLFVTLDGGNSWIRRSTPCKQDGNFQSSVVADSSSSLWLLCGHEPGAGMQNKQLFRSADGGRTWRERPQPEGAGYADAVVAVSPSAAWRWGGRTFIYRTTDDGQTWQLGPQAIGGADSLYGFDALTSTSAWALSKDYSANSDTAYVWRTTDGTHWTKARLAR